jgi:hypothetical protein
MLCQPSYSIAIGSRKGTFAAVLKFPHEIYDQFNKHSIL